MQYGAMPMNGRVCVVTGATAGIGDETAKGLARLGSTVIIVGRNQAKGELVVDNIRKETGNPNIHLMIADFASLQSVRELAKDFLTRFSHLHVLINNIGIINQKRTLTVDGFEKTLAVNHLAPFLLTNLLLDKMKASAPARIINVSSGGHRLFELDFDDLQTTKNYTGQRAYCRTKLANVLFTYELARRLSNTGVTANCLHPGTIITDFYSDFRKNPFMRLIERMMSISPAEGASTSIYLASDAAVNNVSGKYFIKKQEKSSSRPSYDAIAAGQLWAISEQLVGLK